MAGTGHVNRRDLYDAFGRLILVILYYTNATPKTTVYRKSTEMARTDNTYCTKAPISLVITTIGGIKS